VNGSADKQKHKMYQKLHASIKKVSNHLNNQELGSLLETLTAVAKDNTCPEQIQKTFIENLDKLMLERSEENNEISGPPNSPEQNPRKLSIKDIAADCLRKANEKKSLKEKLAKMKEEEEEEESKIKLQSMQERYNRLFGASCLLCSAAVLTALYHIYRKNSDANQKADSKPDSDSNTNQIDTQSCSSKKDFKIGDEVKVRCSNYQHWLYGTIDQLIKVKIHGWEESYAYEWNQIEHNDSSKKKYPRQVPGDFIEDDTSNARFGDIRISFTKSSATNSQKINTWTYEQILKEHFRTTSSTNITLDNCTEKSRVDKENKTKK
jgi:hypothetical protein